MKKLPALFMTASLLLSAPVFANQPPVAEESSQTTTQSELTEAQQYQQWAQQLWDSLDRRTGEIRLDKGETVLNVPDQYYYLSPADAEKVLVDVWGNMPGIGTRTLGMLMPSGVTPFDDASWAVTIEYSAEGYVSDEDAADIDYAELLEDMQADTRAGNDERVRQGYDPVTLIGWASEPYYDQNNHKLYWAKELQFGDSQTHTLNYDIRVLGRKGYLEMSFIANMSQKPEIDAQIEDVLQVASFDDGYRYTDFNPEIDEVAAYGLGALIAGKALSKLGLLAAALVFLKKFGFILLLPVYYVMRKLKERKKD